MLRLEGVTKKFGATTAVNDIILEVAAGEFVSLLGPSGCGKTTTLRMIAGFDLPTAGQIILNDRDVTDLPPHRRGVGMVFQNYALFPHLNVFDNVAFGLRIQKLSKTAIASRVGAALARVQLQDLGQRRVQQLSGGQQQRVALARALAPEPPLLLLDEPLSNLDAALREKTRRELRAMLKDVGITAIFVTHDQEEAFALSDRIALMDQGHIQQFGTAEELYAQPANAFVASFVGRGNELEARLIESDGQHATIELLHGERWQVRPIATLEATPGATVRVLARPEALELRRGTAPVDPVISERRFAGSATIYTVRLGNSDVLVQANHDFQIGDVVSIVPRSADRVFVVGS